jgi:hypothetical protein
MPLELVRNSEPVRKIRIQIGWQYTEHDFGRDVEWAVATAKAQEILDTFKGTPDEG